MAETTAERPGEPFDAVISFDTVHDLPDPAGILIHSFRTDHGSRLRLRLERTQVQCPVRRALTLARTSART